MLPRPDGRCFGEAATHGQIPKIDFAYSFFTVFAGQRGKVLANVASASRSCENLSRLRSVAWVGFVGWIERGEPHQNPRTAVVCQRL